MISVCLCLLIGGCSPGGRLGALLRTAQILLLGEKPQQALLL
jgi:hypothetical protein